MTNHTLSSQHNVSVMEIPKCHKNLYYEAHTPLDILLISLCNMPENYNPRGSCEPRQTLQDEDLKIKTFRSTRLLRASTICAELSGLIWSISIHEALASLDGTPSPNNPVPIVFRSTRLLRASTIPLFPMRSFLWISIHEALASLDMTTRR